MKPKQKGIKGSVNRRCHESKTRLQSNNPPDKAQHGELSMQEMEFVAADVLASKHNALSSEGIFYPRREWTIISSVSQAEISKMDQPILKNLDEDSCSDEEISKEQKNGSMKNYLVLFKLWTSSARISKVSQVTLVRGQFSNAKLSSASIEVSLIMAWSVLQKTTPQWVAKIPTVQLILMIFMLLILILPFAAQYLVLRRMEKCHGLLSVQIVTTKLHMWLKLVKCPRGNLWTFE